MQVKYTAPMADIIGGPLAFQTSLQAVLISMINRYSLIRSRYDHSLGFLSLDQ